jgi:hypothetical protein
MKSFFSNLRRRQLTKTVERHTREVRERNARRADALRRREWIVTALAVTCIADFGFADPLYNFTV